jgi:hypothetical protein
MKILQTNSRWRRNNSADSSSNRSPINKFLLTVALASLISAGSAFRAYAFTAIAFNTDTGVTGAAWNYPTIIAAETKALEGCPGGHIVFTSDRRAFYALDSWRDSNNGTGIVYSSGYTLREAYLKNIQTCSADGHTITEHRGHWQETLNPTPRPVPHSYGSDNEGHAG